MPGPDNRFEAMAREAAQRIARAHETGRQLALLKGPDNPLTERGGRGKGKRQTALARWMAAQGYRDPAEVLAEMAGLASETDAITTAMAQAEQVCAWVGLDDAKARLAVFMQLYTGQRLSAEALMAYHHGKADKPPAPVQAVQVVMPGAAAGPEQAPQVIEGHATGGTWAPPPMPGKVVADQGDSE